MRPTTPCFKAFALAMVAIAVLGGMPAALADRGVSTSTLERLRGTRERREGGREVG